MAYDEAARRLYGPEAYLNLPHLMQQPHHHSSTGTAAFHRYKWMVPSSRSSSVSSLFPPRGLLNLHAQPSVHVIHQRLQELKEKKMNTNTTTPPPPPPVSISSDSRAEEASSEKPQIDLNEFLQQMGILKDEKATTSSIPVEEDENVGLVTNCSSSFGEDKSFWDSFVLDDHRYFEGDNFEFLQDVVQEEEMNFSAQMWNF